jgi:hypothetical protein
LLRSICASVVGGFISFIIGVPENLSILSLDKIIFPFIFFGRSSTSRSSSSGCKISAISARALAYELNRGLGLPKSKNIILFLPGSTSYYSSFPTAI